ncbi:hypothetical protein YQE_12010, partial [Dendroctonus ponderosae]
MFVNTLIWVYSNLCNYLLNGYHLEVQQKEMRINDVRKVDLQSNFEVVYQWTHLNYTWQSEEHYKWALDTKRYIPANNAPTGLKFYQQRLFLSIPRYRPGVPATLVSLDTHDETSHENPLLSPFPNWDSNDDIGSCSNLQSVQSMEVDTRGIMWVIDGVRINNYTRCPAKLIFLDLNNEGRELKTYIFPEKIASQYGGFLNDIVVDETDGDFAYITDNSLMDPGIIVYSRRQNVSWKLRDASMRPNPKAIPFTVDDVLFDASVPVDGIALTPYSHNGKKRLYYCAMSSFTIYSISTSVLKNKPLVTSGKWRRRIRSEGEKNSQSDGIMIDELSTMYLTMLPFSGIASWKTDLPTSTMQLVYTNRETMVWPDGFAFDQQGFLYVICNKVFNYIDLKRTPVISGDTPFRVLKTFTGTRSYLYR